MTDKELIRQEIERRIEDHQSRLRKLANSEYFGRWQEDEELLKFIDSLQEEPNVKNENPSDECPCCGWALDSDGCCSSCGYGRK